MRDYSKIREISNYFYTVSGIYQNVCDYYSYMYRYDWYITPEIYDDTVKEEKVIKDFNKTLMYLDNSHIKTISGEIASYVIRNGAYYGYLVKTANGFALQELPIGYCRSRYKILGNPAIEFNMRYFDDKFPNVQYRMKVLKLFPEEFSKAYILYKTGKLKCEEDELYCNCGCWYLLEPGNTIKFSFNNNDLPLFINAIPTIIDLDTAQDLDRQKQLQQLIKIIIQKLPTDKNGDLIFDIDEARDIHNNAVDMLARAIGVDVMTTFADVEAIDLSDNSTAASEDALEKNERTVYNALGVSKNIFNTTGNLALTKSILQDESKMKQLLLQFIAFFDRIAQECIEAKNRKKYKFRFYMLETTQYNYTDLAKMYKEQTQIGFSKMLPQVALGHSQSAIINTAYFENQVLHLSQIMIPPLMSSTLSGQDILAGVNQGTTSNNQNNIEEKTTGRPAKEDSEKSDKTIANQESMS